MHQIILYYKYTQIADPESIKRGQQELCAELGLRGRVLIASEGINGTLEGTDSNVQRYMAAMDAHPLFGGINWKVSAGTGSAFPKLKIKVRDEIVATGNKQKDWGPMAGITGKNLSADELYSWYVQGREFYVVDMRNDFEYEVGRFANSIFPQGLYRFRNVPEVLQKLEHLKGKTIVTVCTGGVRCETASGLLLKHGFVDVYQLEHGIVTFMEKYPNTFFEGKLYVFDNRLLYGVNVQDKKHKVVGVCRLCKSQSENLINWLEAGVRRHGVICHACVPQVQVA